MNKTLITTISVVAVLLIIVYVLASFTSVFSKVPLINNLAKKNTTGYHAVFLSNNQVYFGKLRNESSQYAVLEDVYYLRQSANSGDETQSGKLDLVKRGRELHGPDKSMRINRDHILFIEDVRPDSDVGRAIQKAKQLTPAQLRQTPQSPTPQATSPGASSNKGKFVRVKESDLGFLRVRVEPNTTASEVGRATSGKSFKVLDEKEGWYQIEYETGKTGWVSGSFVAVE